MMPELSQRRSKRPLSILAASLAACAGTLLSARDAAAQVQATPVMLEWFEASWGNIEYRVPDFFVAGYGSVWLPPASEAADPTSPGYDVFDRFNLGSPTNKTLYGTEDGLRAVIDQFHRAYGQVYLDIIMNHDSGRNGSTDFYGQGGYPGFWLGPGPAPLGTSSNWGDFHNGSKESENPGGSNYDLWTGDLVGLIDIAQESNNQYVRQPVSATPPAGLANIPSGSIYNNPDPNNARFYPDKTLGPSIVNNPGMNRPACCSFPSSSVGAQQFTFYPFNTVTPLNGTPVADNTTGLLMRWTQWMLDSFHVDGFRLDASKHIPPWFWDQYWDSIVYQRRTNWDGTMVTPFSFGENVMANDQTYAFYIRKNSLRAGDSFGNRDGLDINGSGAIRDLVNARGTGNWNNVLSNHLDNADDNDNNGSIGVNHIYSQDNGSSGDGSTQPPLPSADKAAWPEFAYLLLRTGQPEVFHNARQFNNRTGGFWPREGSPEALGLGRSLSGTDPTLTRLVQLHNHYARGAWDVKVLDSDVICFERHYNNMSNVVVCCDDSYSNGYDTRTFATRFPQGTRLVELTGNATDPTVDPNSNIFDTITVGAGGSVTVNVPRNRSATGVEHNKGYVVYGQVTPPGAFSISSGLAQTVPPDDSGILAARRRLTTIDVVQSPSFTIQLQTQNDPTEGALDDNAIYRFNSGFYGSNVGTNATASGEPSGEFNGYENFVTAKNPRALGGSGLYQQTINTSTLPEGYNYLSVIAFRQRAAGTSPIYSEWRDVIYVDRADPVITVDSPVTSCLTGGGTLSIHNPDRTATNIYVFFDLPTSSPIPLLDGSSAAFQYDRTNWLFSYLGLSGGTHTVTVVSQEIVGSALVRTARTTPVAFTVTRLQGDFNNDGHVNSADLGVLLSGFGLSVTPGSTPDINGDGHVNSVDLGILLSNFGSSCAN